jgi:NTE family protein
VLALDASAHVGRAPPDAQAYRANDLRKKALVDADSQHADLVIKPDFGYWAGMSRAYRERVIQAGYRDTLAQAAALRQLHTT